MFTEYIQSTLMGADPILAASEKRYIARLRRADRLSQRQIDLYHEEMAERYEAQAIRDAVEAYLETGELPDILKPDGEAELSKLTAKEVAARNRAGKQQTLHDLHHGANGMVPQPEFKTDDMVSEEELREALDGTAWEIDRIERKDGMLRAVLSCTRFVQETKEEIKSRLKPIVDDAVDRLVEWTSTLSNPAASRDWHKGWQERWDRLARAP